jgi:predicted O-methyltransferase YrrM
MAGPHGDHPPQAVMMQLISGAVVSRCVSLAADLGVADQLKDGPKSVADLAAATGSNADALYRVLRALAGLGIFAELPGRQFRNSPLSETLRSDVQGSVRNIARWMGHPLYWRITGDLDFSVKTGKPAVVKDEPDRHPFEILSRDKSAQACFNEAMTGVSMADGAAICKAYDFSPFARITDVGGGHGMLAMMIARATPSATVTVFDQPHVVEGTRQLVAQAGLAERVQVAGGSFLENVPGPTDLCVLKWILHDWDDQAATGILGNCRKALADGGRVLVCELLITAGPDSIPARIIDIDMMTGPGGRERTADEYGRLFEGAGLKLSRVIETFTPIRLLEATIA